ncbi:MAG: EAL domain-containing protein, partial [Acidobacteriota bacterium]
FLFDYARRKEAIVEFDLACMKRSLECGAELSRKGKLFINVHPQLFAQCHRVNRLLKECALQFDIPLENVVLEITEQEILAAEEPAIRCAAELKRMGLQFALDDVGMSYSHLNLIGAIGPSYLKISHSFGATLHTNPTHEKIIRNIIALATDFDCRVIVEGIEEMATMAAALRVGAQLGQGYFFAEPREVVDFDSTAKRQVQWHAQPMERDHAAR